MPKREEPEFYKRLGAELQAARQAKGLVLADLAKPVGLTFQQLYKYEAGIGTITVGRLDAVCRAMSVSSAAILAKLERADAAAPDRLSHRAAEIGRAFDRLESTDPARNVIAGILKQNGVLE